MKKFYIIVFLLTISVFYGCFSPSISVKTVQHGISYSMFGRIPERDFFNNIIISDSLKLRWENEVYGSFPNSSVTIFDSLVFVNDLSGRVFCFNSNTGKRIGQLKYKGAVYTTPVIKNSWVIFAVRLADKNKSILIYYDYVDGKNIQEIEIDGNVLTELIKTGDGIILNAENGKVFKYSFNGIKLWETNTKTQLHSSPAMSGSIVVFGNDNGEIISIDALNGNIIYRKKIGQSFFCGPSIFKDVVFVGNDNGNLYAVDLKTGNIKWHYNTDARIIMMPAYDSINVMVGNLAGNLFSFRMSDGKLNWICKTDGVFNVTPLVTDNMLIVPDLFKKVVFLDKTNGKIIRDLSLNGRVKLSPVLFNDLLFLGYDNGILRAYEIIY